MTTNHSTKPAPGTIRRTADFNWLSAGITRGSLLTVQMGSVRAGQLISFIYGNTRCIARLIRQERSGKIVAQGTDGMNYTLARHEFKMEGAVIEIRTAPAERREAQRRAGNVVDLNLWRQSHARPIKTCAVRV